jgi:hypothetical protein
LERVYLGGVVVDAMQDGANHIGEFQSIGRKYLGLVDGQVD